MPILFVRHAVAVGRRKWDDDDDARPLSKRGLRQAEAVAERLAAYPLTAVVSSPALRCTQTVLPLAEAVRLPVERHEALAEGAGHEATDFLRGLLGQTVAMCSHGDVIPRVLEGLVVHDGLDLGEYPECAKGSTWVLEDDGTRFVKAFYIEPPA